MSDRTIRRAAERKALKEARKQTHQSNSSPSETATSLPTAAAAPIAQPVSEAQLAANRANALLSHGPVTDEGKAVSSRNHTSHGLTASPSGSYKVLPDEDQSAYDASLAGYQTEWQPVTVTEHELVKRLSTHAWIRDRATRLQDRILVETAGGDMDTATRKKFDLFARYHTLHARAFSKTFSEIMRLRTFQSRQDKDAAILERRALDLQIRFESQKRAAELHAAKLETSASSRKRSNSENSPLPSPNPSPRQLKLPSLSPPELRAVL